MAKMHDLGHDELGRKSAVYNHIHFVIIWQQ